MNEALDEVLMADDHSPPPDNDDEAYCSFFYSVACRVEQKVREKEAVEDCIGLGKAYWYMREVMTFLDLDLELTNSTREGGNSAAGYAHRFASFLTSRGVGWLDPAFPTPPIRVHTGAQTVPPPRPKTTSNNPSAQTDTPPPKQRYAEAATNTAPSSKVPPRRGAAATPGPGHGPAPAPAPSHFPPYEDFSRYEEEEEEEGAPLPPKRNREGEAEAVVPPLPPPPHHPTTPQVP